MSAAHCLIRKARILHRVRPAEQQLARRDVGKKIRVAQLDVADDVALERLRA